MFYGINDIFSPNILMTLKEYLKDYESENTIKLGEKIINDKEMKNRLNIEKTQNIPIINYHTIIAHINGILKRTIAMI